MCIRDSVIVCHEYKLACHKRCWQTRWIAALCWWRTLSGSLMTNCWSFTIVATKVPKTITFTHLWKYLNFCIFERDSAPASIACEMVKFLDCETPDFIPPCCLVLIWRTFFISEQDKVLHRSRVANDRTSWDKPVVLVMHYDVSITSRLAKNI